MTEVKLPTPKTFALYQQVLPDLPEPIEVERPARIKLPRCARCYDTYLDTRLVAAAKGKWACERGHGILPT